MLRKTVTAAALLLATFAATGCEEEATQNEQIEAPAYQDGSQADCEGGALRLAIKDDHPKLGFNDFHAMRRYLALNGSEDVEASTVSLSVCAPPAPVLAWSSVMICKLAVPLKLAVGSKERPSRAIRC